MFSLKIVYISLAALAALVLVLLRFIYKKSFMMQTPMPKKPIPCQPDDFHLAYENVLFSAADGTMLKGWFIPSLDEYSRETIILCHGRGSNKGELLQRTRFLADKYNLLYFDFRACGESGGNMSTIGYIETRDFDAAYQFLKNNRDGYADGIAVFGSSVGASVAIYGAAKYPEIKGIVLDSAFLSLRSVVSNWSRHHLKICLPFIPLSLAFSRRNLKTDPEAYSPKFNAGKLKCPVLFIYGEDDRLIPKNDRNELFQICSSEKKDLFLINGAPHTKCAEIGGVMYREKISVFFKEIFPKSDIKDIPSENDLDIQKTKKKNKKRKR